MSTSAPIVSIEEIRPEDGGDGKARPKLLTHYKIERGTGPKGSKENKTYHFMYRGCCIIGNELSICDEEAFLNSFPQVKTINDIYYVLRQINFDLAIAFSPEDAEKARDLILSKYIDKGLIHNPSINEMAVVFAGVKDPNVLWRSIHFVKALQGGDKIRQVADIAFALSYQMHDIDLSKPIPDIYERIESLATLTKQEQEKKDALIRQGRAPVLANFMEANRFQQYVEELKFKLLLKHSLPLLLSRERWQEFDEFCNERDESGAKKRKNLTDLCSVPKSETAPEYAEEIIFDINLAPVEIKSGLSKDIDPRDLDELERLNRLLLDLDTRKYGLLRAAKRHERDQIAERICSKLGAFPVSDSPHHAAKNVYIMGAMTHALYEFERVQESCQSLSRLNDTQAISIAEEELNALLDSYADFLVLQERYSPLEADALVNRTTRLDATMKALVDLAANQEFYSSGEVLMLGDKPPSSDEFVAVFDQNIADHSSSSSHDSGRLHSVLSKMQEMVSEQGMDIKIADKESAVTIIDKVKEARAMMVLSAAAIHPGQFVLRSNREAKALQDVIATVVRPPVEHRVFGHMIDKDYIDEDVRENRDYVKRVLDEVQRQNSTIIGQILHGKKVSDYFNATSQSVDGTPLTPEKRDIAYGRIAQRTAIELTCRRGTSDVISVMVDGLPSFVSQKVIDPDLVRDDLKKKSL